MDILLDAIDECKKNLNKETKGDHMQRKGDEMTGNCEDIYGRPP